MSVALRMRWRISGCPRAMVCSRYSAGLFLRCLRYSGRHTAPTLMQRKNSPAEYLLQTIALGHPEMRHRMRNATLIGNEARATGNYSYQSTGMRGERYIMVGDAYAFVDPVFSSGVMLGMSSSVRGAEAVDAWLR